MRPLLSTLSIAVILSACGSDTPSLRVGESLDGALDSTDQVSTEGPYQDRWTFDAQAGQRIRVEMTSSDLDSYLRLLGPDGNVLATNDDGLGRDAAINLGAAATGRYTALATTYGTEKHSGAYRIMVQQVTGDYPDPRAVGTIAEGETKEGLLEVGDSATASETLVDVYQFRPSHDGMVVIDLTSSQVDPYLAVQDSMGQSLATDDDSGDDRNSRISQQVTGGALYRLAVGTFGSRARYGSYRLAVRFGP